MGMGLFGGSKQKSSSTSSSVSDSSSRNWNNAYPQLSQALSGTVGQTGGASNAISALLGLGGNTAAQNEAFKNFRDNSGYNFIQQQGMDGITGSAAAQGLLNSGSTLKALSTFNQNLASKSINDYLSNLFNLGNMGLSAAGTLANAGQESTSQSHSQSNSSSTSSGKSKPGIAGVLGGIASGIAGG